MRSSEESPVATPVVGQPVVGDKPTKLLELVKKTAWIVGSALIVFAAVRNSVIWHMQRFWGASADFWVRHWESLYINWFLENNAALFILGTLIVTNGVFVLGNSFLVFLDLTGKPAFLLRYKVQEDQNVPMDRKKFRRAVIQILFNIIVVSTPFIVFMYKAYEWRGVPYRGDDLPTFQWVLFEIGFCSVVEEFTFYYSHRMLHHPRLYKHIHKIHHEWTAPIGFISIYAHPIEHVLSNLFPPMLGPFLLGSHIGTAWLWFSVALLSTTVAHSGYHFPLLPSPEAHDFHHLKFTNNFGVLGILDRFHGTDLQFRASKQYERHSLLLGLTPMSQQFPDNKKGQKGKKELSE
ncbi:fatty acid hydroxylase domain-containing protein 2-like [Lineus longissimus]|uniref:fatty acid hydroxylase domain-containing protein 2-like n=1 Tax=Lineus longissimus TaxID=88925 RepID=UPI002B4DFFB6